VEAYDALGKLLMDGGHYASAESNFHEVLAIQPAYSQTHLNMGWLYVYVGKYNESTHYFYRGLKVQPNSIYGRIGLATSMARREDYQGALGEYRKVLGRDKNNSEALFGVGWCMNELGRYNEAEYSLNKAIEADPENSLAYESLGDLYFRQQKYAESIGSYRMAVVLQEDLADAHLGLGQALEAVGHLTEAEESLQKALYHDPDNAVALYRLGQVHALMNNKARAQSYYEMAIEKSVGDVEFQSTIRSAMQSLSEEEAE